MRETAGLFSFVRTLAQAWRPDVTTEEFGTWVEKHYGDMLAVARRRIDFDPEDIVQSALEAMLKSPTLAKVKESKEPGVLGVWVWAERIISRTADHTRRARAREEIRVEKSLSSGGVSHVDE